MPEERELNDAEREEIHEAAAEALGVLKSEAPDTTAVVRAIEERIVTARRVKADRDEAAFRLGALLAHCFEEELGWELVELTWESLQAPAVVTMDRSLVVLPFLAVAELFANPDAPPALASSFERLANGDLPPGLTRSGYAVLLP